MKFQKISEQWLKWYAGQVMTSTWQGYRDKVNKLNIVFGNKDIKNISAQDVRSYLTEELYQKQHYAKDTIRKYRNTLSLIFDYAVEKYEMPINIAKYARIPNNAQKNVRFPLTNHQIKSVIKNKDIKPFGLLGLFLMCTGARPAEAIVCKGTDIDFDENVIYLNKSVSYCENIPHIHNWLKTEIVERKIPLIEPLKSSLLPYKDKDVFLFGETPKKLYTKSKMVRRWNEYKRITGINATQYQFRHTFATIAYKAGVDIKTIQALMGHKSINMSLNTYIHYDCELMQKEAILLQDYIKKF